jgi:hypothetical protein
MKLAFVTVLMSVLLPHYAIAQDAPPYRAIASFTSNPTARRTQASLPVIAQQSQTLSTPVSRRMTALSKPIAPSARVPFSFHRHNEK